MSWWTSIRDTVEQAAPAIAGAALTYFSGGTLGAAFLGGLGGGAVGAATGQGFGQGALEGYAGAMGADYLSGTEAAGGTGLLGAGAHLGTVGAAGGGIGTGGATAAGGAAATGGFGSQAASLLLGGAKSLALSQALQQMSQQANTFGPQRQQYANELAQLEANPSSITNLPGYQAGLQAVQRSLAAQGYSGSGNMMAALQGYGANIYNQQVQTLSGLAGAGINPAVPISGMATSGQAALAGLGLLGAGAQQAGF